jgi:hypothetical protein
MATKLKLLWWFFVDAFNCEHPRALMVSQERINRELRKPETIHDEATVKCIARVKRRMLLGKLSPDAPMFKGGSSAEAEVAAPSTR